jgi:CubicO group peptidase (beta-lactamase class C family)
MATFDQDRLARAFEIAARDVDRGDVPWAVVGLADAAGVRRVEGFGEVDGRRVGARTVCLIASITKPIVATVVMQLVAEGRVTLATPIGTVVPQAAALGEPPVTAWHLLSHTSGLADIEADGLLARGATHDEAVQALIAQPRMGPPGATYRYATSTFDLLGSLITRLDGRPYPEAIRARLLDPLGMTDTTFDPRTLSGSQVVRPIGGPGGLPVPDAIADAFIDMAMPGAGYWSTADDLLRFGRAMLRGGELDSARVLPSAFVELMTREVTVDGLGRNDDPLQSEHYALGWGRPRPTSPVSRSAFGHGGITGTQLWVDPRHDLVLVYLTGVWEGPDDPADALENAIYAAIEP